jgi:hypothetical protein
MVSMALLELNVSVDRVDVPQIMEMQAVLTDRAYGMRQDACRLTSRSAAARPWSLVPPMVVNGQLNHVRSPGGSWP